VLAAAGAGGFLLAAALARPGGMGMGDVKLGAVMGIFLGPAVVAALLIAFLLGGVVAAAILVRDGGSARKRAIPFAPFLAVGGAVAVWLGDSMVDSYVDAISTG
jgi:leader peptidase (prepilin peptidase)/N-methyltransferase